MSLLATKSPFIAAFKSLGALFLFIFFGLFLDSFYMIKITENAQFYANISMFIGFLTAFSQVNRRVKEQMITAVVIAVLGEYLLSIGLGMYTYRLENVPHYVPPGHALVYVAVLYFSKAKSIIKHRIKLEKIFSIFIFIYATIFLIFKNDVFGFVLTIATLFILRNKPRERLFYLTMYISVAYLEIIGTNFLCWKWPTTAWGVFDFLPSHNPPSGISFFYFLLDLGCLWLYKQRHKIAWSRMKSIRKIRVESFTSMH
jgi:drug/metabolite transporter (DMT)-like permease